MWEERGKVWFQMQVDPEGRDHMVTFQLQLKENEVSTKASGLMNIMNEKHVELHVCLCTIFLIVRLGRYFLVLHLTLFVKSKLMFVNQL